MRRLPTSWPGGDRIVLVFPVLVVPEGTTLPALARWIPLLGDALVCLITLALDESRCGGAITVTREPVPGSEDPFARIFQGTVVRTHLFCEVARGPVLEGYAGVPGGRF